MNTYNRRTIRKNIHIIIRQTKIINPNLAALWFSCSKNKQRLVRQKFRPNFGTILRENFQAVVARGRSLRKLRRYIRISKNFYSFSFPFEFIFAMTRYWCHLVRSQVRAFSTYKLTLSKVCLCSKNVCSDEKLLPAYKDCLFIAVHLTVHLFKVWVWHNFA